MKRNNKGFTLVELLVVIAIIGLLSTIAFIALNQARGKARDAKRVSDIRQLQSALELYYNDQVSPAYPDDGDNDGTVGVLVDETIIESNYVAQVPTAPLPADQPCEDELGSNTYTYNSVTAQGSNTDCSGATCGWYRLTFCLGGATGNLDAGVHTAEPTGIN